MKQRDVVRMSPEEVDDFLSTQRSATVGTLGRDGQIHLVGMWYAYLDGRLWLETKGKSQKAVNLRRDNRISLMVEAGHTYDKLRGVAVEGRGVLIEDDADQLWAVCVNIFERYNGPYSEEMRPFVEAMAKNRVLVRIDVEATRSWDHRKLGLPEMPVGGSTAGAITAP